MSWSSVPPSAMSVSVGAPRESGPSLRQTVLAALAGPALVAVVAAGFAFALSGAHTMARASARPRARVPTGQVASRRRSSHGEGRRRDRAREGLAAIAASPKCARNPRSRACVAAARD